MNHWVRKITFLGIYLSFVTQSFAEGGRSAEALGQGGTGPEPELWVTLTICFTVLGLIWRYETKKHTAQSQIKE